MANDSSRALLAGSTLLAHNDMQKESYASQGEGASHRERLQISPFVSPPLSRSGFCSNCFRYNIFRVLRIVANNDQA